MLIAWKYLSSMRSLQSPQHGLQVRGWLMLAVGGRADWQPTSRGMSSESVPTSLRRAVNWSLYCSDSISQDQTTNCPQNQCGMNDSLIWKFRSKIPFAKPITDKEET